MFIDIHVHTIRKPGPLRNGKPPFATPHQLLSRYDAVEIERGVILPTLSPECSYVSQSNEDSLEISESHPGRFIPFCNVDPRFMTNSERAPLEEILGHYKRQGYKGCGEVTANLPFLHPTVQNLFRACEEVGMPVTFHVAAQIGDIYGLYDDPGLPQLERCLQRFPKLTFLAHSQSFWAEMGALETAADRYGYPQYPVQEEGAAPKLFRRYPNLYGDLSAGSGANALSRDPGYAGKFLDEFQDRMCFGTDICAPDTPTPLVDFLIELRDSGRISETVFNKVARENAIRLLGLKS